MRRLLLAACIMAAPGMMLTAAHASSPEAIAGTAKHQGLDLRVATTADALGMIRLAGEEENLDLVNRLEFTARGKMYAPSQDGQWTESTVDNLVYGASLHQAAARADLTFARPGGEAREIHVVREDLAWNETTPGVGGEPVPNAVAGRQRQILLLPHGFMRAVLRAEPKDLTITEEGGKPVYTVRVDGVPVKGIMGADMRPERIEMPVQHPVLGATVHAVDYSGYKDWEGYEVFFPSRIVQTLGGRTSADLEVTKFMTGPYIVFPIPAGLKPAQTASANAR